MNTQELLLLVNRYTTLCENLHLDPRLNGEDPLRKHNDFRNAYFRLLRVKESLVNQLKSTKQDEF